jgi:hypothetical protein
VNSFVKKGFDFPIMKNEQKKPNLFEQVLTGQNWKNFCKYFSFKPKRGKFYAI